MPLLRVMIGGNSIQLLLVACDGRVDLAGGRGGQVGLRLGVLGRLDLLLSWKIRSMSHSMVPGRRKSSTGIRRSSTRGFRPRGLNGSGTLPKLQMAADGVAPSMWLRGSRIDWSLPTSIPTACGSPRESRNDSEPLTGTRACIRVRAGRPAPRAVYTPTSGRLAWPARPRRRSSCIVRPTVRLRYAG